MESKAGKYKKIGISKFYPYDKIKNIKFNERGNLFETTELREIFGPNILFNKDDTPANGLPYSEVEPEMNGLKSESVELIRELDAIWDGPNTIKLKESLLYNDNGNIHHILLDRFNFEEKKDEELITLAQKFGSKAKTKKGAKSYINLVFTEGFTPTSGVEKFKTKNQRISKKSQKKRI